MFHAFVIVCAAQFNVPLNEGRLCTQYNDSWGPYITEENCEMRKAQMMDELLNGRMNGYAFQQLNYPDMIELEGFCIFLPVGEKV